MITNSKMTLYHKEFDKINKLEKWTRYNFDNVWFYGAKGSSINDGYQNDNAVNVRIPYGINDIDISKIKIGDIIVGEEINEDIQIQNDLSNYEFYNITSIKNNNFGNNPHIHIGGK